MDKYILLGLIATIFAIGSLTNSAEATLPSQSSDLSEWEFRNGGSYVSGNSGTIQNPGSGTDYSVTYWRTNPAVIDHGKQVTFDFYVDQINSKSYFSLIANQPEFERISILETNGKLLAHIKIGDSAAQKITLLSSSDFQANRWYSAAFTVDDTNGFSVEVEDRDNPTVNGFYQLPNNQMSAGATWYFQGWTYQHTTYLDNFSVVDGTSGSPTSTPTSAVPSEWEFRNGGSYVSGNSGTIQNPGSGTDYSVTFWRASPTVIDSGKQVKFDFYVDQTNSKTYLSLLANQTEYERISILETNGKLLVHIKIGDNAAQKFTLLSGGDFQANRWYSAAITVDDTNGFLVEVEDRDNPTISGSYRLQNGLTSAEATWYFQGWTYQHTTFLENYSVDAAPANPTPTPATPSDWEFRNGGSYVSGDFGVIQNPGSGIDYSVTFWRANPATIDDGMQVSFDFYVDQTNSKTYLSLLANQTEYERISILETNGKLLAHVKVGDSAAQKFTLLPAGDFQASRWYSAAITVDDTNGFLVEVADRDDPTVNGSYQTQSDLMSAGITWYFQGWTYQHTAFLDNYAVETNQIDPTATPTATPTFTPTPLPSSTPTVTSTPSPTATPEEPSCGLLEQEAETATVFGRMTIGNDSRASEGQFIHIPDGAGDNYNFSGTSPDRAEFCFEITEAGNYSISAVVSSEGGSALSDSFYVQVNNQPFGGYLWDVTLSNDFVPDHVSDRGGDNKIIVPLDEGENTVSVHLREDGTKLDRIALERESDEPTPEAMPVVASFNSSNGAPLGQGSVIMHQGYLFMPSGKDSGRPGGGFSFYDISDPANPFTVTEKFDSITFPMREPHTIGVQDDTFALQTTEGVMFWDMSDVSNPALITHMDLPEIQEADYGGSWWLHWQAPYLYVATLNNGLYIVNAADPANPVLANRLLPGDLGMAPRGVFLLGNIMVTTQNNRVKTFDVSDPVNPVALDFVNTASAYSWLLHGDLVLGAGDGQQLIVVSIADPTNLVELSSDAVLGGPGAYLTVQDNFAHVGASDHYIKIDIADPANPVAVGQGSSGLSGRDEDFATALGNLVFVGNDHENGSVLLQHDPNPDTTGPAVVSMSPTDGATNQATSSRIGISFSDLIDVATLDTSNLAVQPVINGTAGPVVSGIFSHQFGLVNFAPSSPLIPNTTYQITLLAGGVKDVSGNGTPTQFVSTFTTGADSGNNVNPPVINSVTASTAQPFEVNQAVTLSVDASDPDMPLEVLWNFGDGTILDWSSSQSSVAHTFSAAGNYSVLVRVRDASGASSATIYNVSVAEPPPLSQPQQASQLALDDGRRQLWAVNPDNDTVTLIHADNLNVIQEIAVCDQPTSVAIDGQDQVWITCQKADQLRVLSAADGSLISNLDMPYGSGPVSIVFTPDGSTGYMAEYASGRIVKINPSTRTVTSGFVIGNTPQALAISGDGNQLLISQFISPDSAGQLWSVDLSNFGSASLISLPIDTTTADSDKAGRGLPNYVSSIAIHPNNQQAWVSSKKDNILRGQFRDGLPLTFETTVRALLASIDLTNNQETVASRIDVNNHAQPAAAVYSPLGNHLFVAMQGNNRILVLDGQSGAEIARANTGLAPQAVLVDPTTNRVFSKDFLGRSVTVFDGNTILTQGAGDLTQIAQISTVQTEILTSEVLQGKRLFYNAADTRLAGDGYMSCASCHINGDHDGRTWDMTSLGEGLRNTTALNGRIGSDMLHWTGNFDEIHDFEMQIRSLAGGTGLMDDADLNVGTRSEPLGDPKAGISSDLDALATYVQSLLSVGKSPYKNPDGSLTTLAETGKTLFTAKSCASCHGGPTFSDSGGTARFDVGTAGVGSGQRLGQPLDGFDPPSLRGLWNTAPYLHDGSAATLNDVLSNPTHAGVLSSAEIDALVAYLLQIDDAETQAAGGEPPLGDSGDSYYVSRSGDNSSGQDWSTAWSELDQIDWSVIEPGDTIYLDGGPSEMTYSTQLKPAQSGTVANPILIQLSDEAGRGGKAILFGGNSVPLPECGQLNWDNSQHAAAGSNAIRFEDGVSNIVVDGRKRGGITIHGWNRDAIAFSPDRSNNGVDNNSQNVTLRYMEIYNNGDIRSTNDGSTQNIYLPHNGSSGIELSGIGHTFEYLEIHDNAADAIQSAFTNPAGNVFNNIDDITIRNSWFYNQRPHSGTDNSPAGEVCSLSNPSGCDELGAPHMALDYQNYPVAPPNRIESFNWCTHSDGVQIYSSNDLNDFRIERSIIGPNLMTALILGDRTPPNTSAWVNNLAIEDVVITRFMHNALGMNNPPSSAGQNWQIENVTMYGHYSNTQKRSLGIDSDATNTEHTVKETVMVFGATDFATPHNIDFSTNCEFALYADTIEGTNIDPNFANIISTDVFENDLNVDFATIFLDDYTVQEPQCAGVGSSLTSVSDLLSSFVDEP